MSDSCAASQAKEYDARADGLTNGGKGGAVKGVSTLLEGLQKKGLIKVMSSSLQPHLGSSC